MLIVVLALVYCSSALTDDVRLKSTSVSSMRCENITSCDKCAHNTSCLWCGPKMDNKPKHGTCISVAEIGKTNSSNLTSCQSGWCQGDACTCHHPCTDSIFPCSDNIVGILILLGFYAVVLAYGAKLISDGSELLLEIFNPGIIGGLVIPVLGAVPDAAIIVMSGVVGSRDVAQEQVAVGVGTLAGSTIMLLTLTWGASLILARSDVVYGESVDKKRKSGLRGWHPYNTGTTVDTDTRVNAVIMILTSVTYLVVQGVAFAYLGDPKGDNAHKVERWFALAAFIIATFFLAAYSLYQVLNPALQEKKINNARERLRLELAVKAFEKMKAKRLEETAEHVEYSLVPTDIATSSVVIDDATLRALGVKWKIMALKHDEEEKEMRASAINDGEEVEDEEDSDEEEEEIDLTPIQIGIKAFILLVIGTTLCTFFSDPMVEVINDFGKKIHIGAFFVSFIITPFCSNASELISSLIFASKMTKKNSSLTFSAIYGAATMNNTLGLGVFCALIFFRKLAWTFSAETVSILFVTVCVGIVGILFKTLRIFWAPLIFALYPFSIFLVWILEYAANWT